MALIITGSKGAIGVSNAYLVLTSVSVHKRMSMVNGDAVPAVFIVARGSLFNSREDRMSGRDAPMLEVTFDYVPSGEQYPVQAAYDQIKAHGIPGWSLTIIVDA